MASFSVQTPNPLSFQNHEFGEILAKQRDFLKLQEILTDYDVDQSVIDIILSAMAFNTQNNAITANGLFSEAFGSTAIQRKNVIASAKERGYTPYSMISARALLDIESGGNTEPDFPQYVIMEKGTVFQATGVGESVPFTVVRPAVGTYNGSTYAFQGVEVVQGTYGSVDIVIDKSKRDQVYEIPIDDIDTNFLEVYVQESQNSNDFVEYKRANTSVSVNGDSKVFFLQEVDNQRFGIEFGDGTLGHYVQDGTIVRVVYFVTKGPDGNNFRAFSFGYSPSSDSILNQLTHVITTVSKSTGGMDRESVDSIKRNYPRFYVSQNRGVLSSDVKDILEQRLPYLNSVSVWSGKEGKGYYDQLGRVYISANTDKAQYLTDLQKKDVLNLVRSEIGVAGIVPVLVDADNIFIELNATVFVDDFVFLKASDIKKLVANYAVSFNEKNLENFAGTFEHSRFTEGVNDLHPSIKSNLVKVLIFKKIFPDTRVKTTFEFSFMNKIASVYTNSFSFEGKTVTIKSSADGTLNVYETVNNSDSLVRAAIGTVDFTSGDVTVSDITVTRVNKLTNDLRFYAVPVVENIRSGKNNIVVIDSINTEVEQERNDG